MWKLLQMALVIGQKSKMLQTGIKCHCEQSEAILFSSPFHYQKNSPCSSRIFLTCSNFWYIIVLIVETIKLLNNKEKPLFTLNELGNILQIENRGSLYKKIAHLIYKGILKLLTNGKYEYLLKNTNDFTRSNFLYQPSYISLESALSFYSIITQFPYEITAVSPKKTKKIEIDEKLFSYSQINPKYFFGYENNNGFLIATPEKALLDYLYMAERGLRKIEIDEMNLTKINKKAFNNWGCIMGIDHKL